MLARHKKEKGQRQDMVGGVKFDVVNK